MPNAATRKVIFAVLLILAVVETAREFTSIFSIANYAEIEGLVFNNISIDKRMVPKGLLPVDFILVVYCINYKCCLFASGEYWLATSKG